jgi:hypothetical protein
VLTSGTVTFSDVDAMLPATSVNDSVTM